VNETLLMEVILKVYRSEGQNQVRSVECM